MNPRKYLDQLFISKVRIKSIRFFLMNPDKSIHLRGAVRELNEEINAVRRELSRLESIKFVISERRGNRKYFQVNPNFLYYDELQSIIFKSFGLGGEIVRGARKLGEIRFAVLTNSFMQKRAATSAGLDLIVVGENIDMHELDELVTREEQKLDRHINYTVLSNRDFDLHKRRKDTFILDILTHGRVMLIGDGEEFVAME